MKNQGTENTGGCRNRALFSILIGIIKRFEVLADD